MFVNNPNELDQHFLIDKDIINSFINICNLSEDDIVLEIGPGIGTLTKLIAPKVKKLYVIEKDIRLKPYFPKVYKIITSLPYSIIEPFIYKIINEDFKELYMIMGKKYCDNVLGNKITNLSLLTNIYFKITKYFDIMPDSFNPKPRVVSSLIKLEFKKDNSEKELIFKNMYKLNDKLVKNALLESLIIVKNLTKRDAKEYIKNLNIKESILNNKFSQINNNELEELYNQIKTP